MHTLPEANLIIHDLVNGNSQYIEDYLKIYSELFPQYLRYLPVMRRRAEFTADRDAFEKWHQWLLVVENKPVGIVGILYNRKRNVGLLMDFAIYPNSRRIQVHGGLPFSKYILNLSMQELVEDAKENQYPAPICMAAEVEYPALLRKYIEYGYVKFPVEYFEPPSTPELEKVGDKIQNLKSVEFGRMNVGAFQIPGFSQDLTNPEVIRIVLSALLEDHYQLSSDHWLVRKVIQGISV